MTHITLVDLFEELNGRRYDNRQQLEDAVLEVFNRHVAELPVGYSYLDAIDGAREQGWLQTNGGPTGVRVMLGTVTPTPV